MMISSSLGVRTLAPTSPATNIDCQPPKGHEISPSLLRAIEDSYVSVLAFAENNASSRLYSEVNGQIVIPVFYIVEPSHVRNQIRLYEQAFEKFERDLKDNQHKMQIWKQALNEAANLAGDDSHTCSGNAEPTTRQARPWFSATLVFLKRDLGLPKGKFGFAYEQTRTFYLWMGKTWLCVLYNFLMSKHVEC